MKNKLANIFKESLDIARRNEISSTLITKNENLYRELCDYKVKVPLMGGFNAGKSSLINHFLGNELLPTDIKPETVIATEIKYTEGEGKIVAHRKNGESEELEIGQIQTIDPVQNLYIELYYNQEKLKELGDVILVDMPGLDSSIQTHNQAILSYIEEGTFYIVVAEVDHGLQESVLNFLRELNIYELNFAVLISKVDHKLPKDTENILQIAKKTVSQIVNKDVLTGKTSVVDDDIEDFIQIVRSINPDEFVERKFVPVIREFLEKCIRELHIRVRYYNEDTEDIDKKIQSISQGIQEIESQIAKEAKVLEEKFNNTTVNHILDDISQALHNNMYSLSQAFRSGSEVFSRRVNDIVRPVITRSLGENLTEDLTVSIEHINSSFQEMLSNSSILDFEKSVTRMSEKVDKLVGKIEDPKVRGVLATLAITTQIVAPWMELAILFLPEIMEIFKSLFGNEEEEIRQRLRQEIIPEILHQWEPEILNSLLEIKNNFIEQMKANMKTNKEDLKNALEKAKKEKNLREDEFVEKKLAIEQDVEAFQQLKQQL